MYGLCPALLYNILPYPFYHNFCCLVTGIRIIYQKSISRSQARQASKALQSFVTGFEELYYRYELARLHMVRPCLHILLHLADEIIRLGPGICYSQWTMERTIGNLGEEVKQDSRPFENLTNRAITRARVNALYSMIPNLAPKKSLPTTSIDLYDGYILLFARSESLIAAKPLESSAFSLYLSTYEPNISIPPHLRSGLPEGTWQLRRWARLRLPNDQIARSAWKEKGRSSDNIRMSRFVKVNLFWFLCHKSVFVLIIYC
jgi:hypothetical protein